MTGAPARRFVVVVLVTGVATLLLAGVVVGSDAGTSPVVTDSERSFISSIAPNDEYDRITTRIILKPDGTAQWRVQFRYRLSNNASEQAWKRTRTIAEKEELPKKFINRMQAAVNRSETATGRSMTTRWEAPSRRKSLPDGRFGVITYPFEWTNFAEQSGDTYVVGDAIGGFILGPNETLMIEWGDRFERESVSPRPNASQAGAVSWEGSYQFATSAPEVQLRLTGASSSGLPILPAAGVLGLVVVLGGGWVARSRLNDEETPAEESGTDQPAGVPTDELLSDEEKVLQLLESRGGRMKQQDVIEAMDWSRTKTSDVVSEMHENEQIEKFRLGRENVLALPGEIEI